MSCCHNKDYIKIRTHVYCTFVSIYIALYKDYFRYNLSSDIVHVPEMTVYTIPKLLYKMYVVYCSFCFHNNVGKSI